MHRTSRKLWVTSAQATFGAADSAFARKADICAKILAEAHRLARVGQFATPLNQMVFRACELLDDMDDVLVALHPVRNSGEFATAAALHRELEQIQAAIRVPNRGPASTSKAGPVR